MAFYDDDEIKKDFPLIYKVATSFISIPYSRAHLERLFHHLKLNSTALRNRLDSETLESILLNKDDENLKLEVKKSYNSSKFNQKLLNIEHSFSTNAEKPIPNIKKI